MQQNKYFTIYLSILLVAFILSVANWFLPDAIIPELLNWILWLLATSVTVSVGIKEFRLNNKLDGVLVILFGALSLYIWPLLLLILRRGKQYDPADPYTKEEKNKAFKSFRLWWPIYILCTIASVTTFVVLAIAVINGADVTTFTIIWLALSITFMIVTVKFLFVMFKYLMVWSKFDKDDFQILKFVVLTFLTYGTYTFFVTKKYIQE